MADSAYVLGRLGPTVRGRSLAEGDAPEEVLRRYLVDQRGGAGLGFYPSRQSPAPAFRDLGRQLVSARNDAASLADMMAIARHRRWTIVKARGSAAFRREAWLAGRLAGLDVRGWRPTEQDLRLLGQRAAERAREDAAQMALRRSGDGPALLRGDTPRRDDGSRALLAVIETVVRRRIAAPDDQEKVLAKVGARIGGWLQRGARFEAQLSLEALSQRRDERQR
jgi:hypothetical protein